MTFTLAPNDSAPRADRNRLTAPDRSIEHIGPDECLELLAGQHTGRLAYTGVDGFPVILPVNYLLHAGAVVFRTDTGPKLTVARAGAPVAFEIDGLDMRTRVGWSVAVSGHAEQVTQESELEVLRGTSLAPWAPGPKIYFVRIAARSVTGRRIRRQGLPSNWWG